MIRANCLFQQVIGESIYLVEGKRVAMTAEEDVGK
jgi:hypothetical protein